MIDMKSKLWEIISCKIEYLQLVIFEEGMIKGRLFVDVNAVENVSILGLISPKINFSINPSQREDKQTKNK